MKHKVKRALAAIAAATCMLFSFDTPALAIGAVGATSATSIRITFQHPGYTAHGLPLYQGKKYRVCIGDLIKGETCTHGDGQSVDYHGVVAGSTYRIVVWCGCKGSGRLAVPIPIRLMDIQHKHSEPGLPTPPRIVRLRSAQTGLCLYPQQNRLLYAIPCGPLSITRFAIEDVPGGSQLRHLATGACIHGSFPTPNTVVVMAPCGKFGTRFWVRDSQNGRFRLDIPSTEDQVPGYPPAKGLAGCIKPPPDTTAHATKAECHWEPWIQADMFYLDPA